MSDLITKVGYKYRVESYDGLHLSECLVVFWPDQGYECSCGAIGETWDPTNEFEQDPEPVSDGGSET